MAVSIHGNNGFITTNGTATAPSFAAPDNNTGLYFGTNLIHASTAGSNRLSIIADGKVGIGTTTPLNNLHLKYSGNNGVSFRMQNDEGSGIIHQDAGEFVYDAAGHIFRNAAGSAERIRIASDGKTSVGTVQTTHTLGVTGGSSSQLLVKGGEADVWLTSTGSGSNKTWRILGSTGGSTHQFRIYDGTNSRDALTISNDGNIGVYGIPVPSFSAINAVAAGTVRGIEIFRDGTDTGTALKLAGDNGSGTKSWSQLGYSGANATSHWANYNTAGTKTGEIVIGSTGNIGIGDRTSSPDADLHVHTASGESTIHVEGATNANLNLRSHSGDSTVKFSDASASNVGNINYDHGTDSLSFRVNSSPRLFISSVGNVAIGHTSAGNKLQVGNTGHSGYALATISGTYGTVLQVGDGTTPTTAAALWVRNLNNGGTATTCFRVNGNGKIMVGNESVPDHQLHIKGNATTGNDPILAVESSSWASGRSAAIRLAYTDGNPREIRGHYDHGLIFTLNQGEAMRIHTTNMIGINQGSSYNPLTSLDIRHPNGTAGNATKQYLLTICAGRNSARGLEIGTGHPTSGNQNDAGVYYNAKDTESSAYHAQHVWQTGGTNRMVLGYTGVGSRLGVGTDTPGGRNGSIDISCDDSTTWNPTSDQRGEASLTLRNPSANTNTFTAMHFFSGGGTGSDVTLAAVRKGNMEADFHLMRRINNAGSGQDNRTSITSRGLSTGPKVIIWAEGTGDNNGDQQCGNHIFESQQMPGFNQYVYWNFKVGSASYSRAGSLRYHCTWSTGHASGTGYQIGTILWVNNHNNSTCNVVEHLVYRRRYNSGHHYGWTSAPELEVYQSNNTGTNASIIFRCQGHGSHNSNSYNMTTVVHLHIEHMSVAQNSITPRLERFGSTSVSGTGSIVDGTKRGYCTFSDSEPVSNSADF